MFGRLLCQNISKESFGTCFQKNVFASIIKKKFGNTFLVDQDSSFQLKNLQLVTQNEQPKRYCDQSNPLAMQLKITRKTIERPWHGKPNAMAQQQRVDRFPNSCDVPKFHILESPCRLSNSLYSAYFPCDMRYLARILPTFLSIV